MAANMQAIRDFYVADTAVVTGNVVCSPGVNIWFGCVLRGDLAPIVLGNRVNLQDGTIVHTDSDAPLTLEDGVVVGHGAIIHCKSIGRDTLIGMGARILGGAEIGPECLVAAGALVTEGRRVPPRSVLMGVPAKVIRQISDEELERTRSICVHYLEMAQRYVRGAYPPPWHRLEANKGS